MKTEKAVSMVTIWRREAWEPKKRIFIVKCNNFIIFEWWLQNHFNSHLPTVRPYQMDESISNFRGVWCTFSILFYFE